MPAVPPAGRGGMAAATFGAAWRGGIILPEPRKCMPLNRACKPAYAWREDKDSEPCAVQRVDNSSALAYNHLN